MTSPQFSKRWLSTLVALLVVGACKDGLSVPDADAGRSDGFESTQGPATATEPPPEPCEHSEDGEACGEGKHCLGQLCVFNSCGDGIKAGDEECDDGNALLEDMCSPSCKIISMKCGDGKVDEGEECDDGNHLDLDACANACKRNACGNERIDPGEECDDGNRSNLDICSNNCTLNSCRNAIPDPGEECDDGNTNDADACSNRCTRNVCSNGRVDPGEECDDRNPVDADACSNLCKINACGNNRVDPGEFCDGLATRDGKPLPAGSLCEKNCSAAKNDQACRECERRVCSNYMESGVDLPRYCYDEVPTSDGVPIPFVDWNQKCTALVRCVQQSGCDHNPEAQQPDEPNNPFWCYCGASTTFTDCREKPEVQTGVCEAEWEAVTGAVKGDYVAVNNNAKAQALPSGWAFLLATCQADATEGCRSVCR